MEMTAAELAAHVRKQFAKIIVGQGEALDQLLLVLLARGHALIEGVPGLAKTLAVKSLAHLFCLHFQRVQCTPDLIPADVLGGNIFEPATSTFRLHRGPVFTDLLLVDEINRMPPRTQSSLLEAMEELQVTIDGTRHPLSNSFAVFATQNPVEFDLGQMLRRQRGPKVRITLAHPRHNLLLERQRQLAVRRTASQSVNQRPISAVLHAHQQPPYLTVAHLKPPSGFHLRQMLLFHVV